MSYQVTARKWRPMIFDDIIGQPHIVNTLRNAIAYNRIAHAYIFSGIRGCGKTTTARILARALNCLSPINQNPDNTCENCTEILEGRSLDVIEIDGASNRGIEEIRNLRESVRFMPTRGKYKIYIIDEVHMLTKEAFNALLKTLEEPPSHCIFIFATTEVHKVPLTILSRCQRFDFRRISVSEIVNSLKKIASAENISIDDDALIIIAKRAEGSLRDAQSIFDQVRTYCGSEIKAADLIKAFNIVQQDLYFQLSDLLKKHDSLGVLKLVNEVICSGYDINEFVSGIIEHFRNLLVTRSTKSTVLIDASEHYKHLYEVEAQNFSEIDLVRYLRQINELEQTLRWSAQPRYKLEATLVQMAKMENSIQLAELLKEIDELKKKFHNENTQTIEKPIKEQEIRTTGIKVIGKVDAGYLSRTLSQEHSTTLTETTVLNKIKDHSNQYKVNIPNPAPSQDAPVSAVIGQMISYEEVNRYWPELVNTISKSHIAVGTSLTTTSILGVTNGLVKIACSDDYNFNTIKRHKELLARTFHKILGKHVEIEPVLRSNPNIPVKEVFTTKQSQPTAKSSTTSDLSDNPSLNEHPILQILKNELGAEPIDFI